MEKERGTCKYQNEGLGDYECSRSPWEGSKRGYCIFHSENPDKVEDFEKGIQEKLEEEDYNFRGFCFPERFDSRKYFSGREFKKSVGFQDENLRRVSGLVLQSFLGMYLLIELNSLENGPLLMERNSLEEGHHLQEHNSQEEEQPSIEPNSKVKKRHHLLVQSSQVKDIPLLRTLNSQGG